MCRYHFKLLSPIIRSFFYTNYNQMIFDTMQGHLIISKRPWLRHQKKFEQILLRRFNHRSLVQESGPRPMHAMDSSWTWMGLIMMLQSLKEYNIKICESLFKFVPRFKKSIHLRVERCYIFKLSLIFKIILYHELKLKNEMCFTSLLHIFIERLSIHSIQFNVKKNFNVEDSNLNFFVWS